MIDDVVVAGPHAAPVGALAERRVDAACSRPGDDSTASPCRPLDQLEVDACGAEYGQPGSTRSPGSGRRRPAGGARAAAAKGCQTRSPPRARARSNTRASRGRDSTSRAASGPPGPRGAICRARRSGRGGEADGLEVLDADHLAERALVERPPHEPRVGRVAQHVGDRGDHAGALGGLGDRDALASVVRAASRSAARTPARRARSPARCAPVERRDDRRVGDAAPPVTASRQSLKRRSGATPWASASASRRSSRGSATATTRARSGYRAAQPAKVAPREPPPAISSSTGAIRSWRAPSRSAPGRA